MWCVSMISKEYAKLMVLNRVREIKNQGLATYDTNTSQIVRDALERMVIPKPIIGLNTKGCSYANNQEGCFITKGAQRVTNTPSFRVGMK